MRVMTISYQCIIYLQFNSSAIKSPVVADYTSQESAEILFQDALISKKSTRDDAENRN